MLKSIIILVFMMLTMQSVYANQFITGTVEAVEIGATDETGSISLCITYLYSSEKNKVYGVVEDLYDCYYARKNSAMIGEEASIPSGFLFQLYQELEGHLLDNKQSVHYLFSEIE
jgi:hypothetical protein